MIPFIAACYLMIGLGQYGFISFLLFKFRRSRREFAAKLITSPVLPPISVLLPVKGVLPHFEENLKSILSQDYVEHGGQVEFRFDDGSTHVLGPGGLARVDPQTHRGMRNVGDGDAIILVVGGKDGYVGRDGRAPDGGSPDGPPGAA